MAILVLSHPLPAAPFVAALRALAGDVPVWTEADAPPPDAVEVLLVWRLKEGQVSRYPKLRAVCAVAAGVDKILSAPDLPPGLPVTRTVDAQQARSMAQYVVACALRHLRALDRYQEQQARADWTRHPQRPLDACRIGLLGQGEVAQAIARAFLPLGCPVSLWGRTGRALPAELAGQVGRHVGEAGLPALLRASDVLVCTLPLTPATHGLLDRTRLSGLPRGAYVVNVGRGEHVVEADLRALLDEGHLAGAALDVLEREPPPPEHWTWRHPRVVATPHIAGEARLEVVAAECLETLHRARAGLPLPRAVDRLAGY